MLKLENIDHTLLNIEALQKEHISEIQELWISQYLTVKEKNEYLPQAWLDDKLHFTRFIEHHIKNNAGIIITSDHKIVGYMTYDIFDFHNEKTAFFPIMAHAVDPNYKLIVYSKMYTHLSQQLVEQGCLNHIMIFYSTDKTFQNYLFELGFGLYVVDAYRDLQSISQDSIDNEVFVRQATKEDINELYNLVKESDDYYIKAPLFLKRESESKTEIQNMLVSSDDAVFVAIKNKKIIGFMNIRCNDMENVISLSDTATALIDPLGAYIVKEYRGKGIGKMLLNEAITWSSRKEIKTIHVDFESANYHANQFWPKYFTPILYSVKRRLNNDVT